MPANNPEAAFYRELAASIGRKNMAELTAPSLDLIRTILEKHSLGVIAAFQEDRQRIEAATIERCAKVCEEMRRQMQDRSADNHYTACAQSIRALTPAQKASDGNNGERK